VVDVQMADEDLVDQVVGDLLRGDALVTAGADVEEELVAVPELDQPAGRRLLGPRARHAGSEGNDSHLVGRELLGPRVVDVSLLHRFRNGRHGLGGQRFGPPEEVTES
jgi:hypothetical protein